MVTKAELQTRLVDLQKEIDGGKFKGEKLRLAKKRIHMLNFKIRHFRGRGKKSNPTESAQLQMDDTAFAKVAAKADELTAKRKSEQPKVFQGILPGFLGSLNNARIEEMVAEKIFQHVATAVDAAIESAFGGKKQA